MEHNGSYLPIGHEEQFSEGDVVTASYRGNQDKQQWAVGRVISVKPNYVMCDRLDSTPIDKFGIGVDGMFFNPESNARDMDLLYVGISEDMLATREQIEQSLDGDSE